MPMGSTPCALVLSVSTFAPNCYNTMLQHALPLHCQLFRLNTSVCEL